MHNTAFLLLLFCSLLLLLDLVLSLFFAHLKVEPERHKATVPSFSSSSAFCCCCLKAFCPSSSHTSRWSLTDTKQNMSSCCSIHLCGQNTVHKSCMKADTCHLTLLTLSLLPHVCFVPPHRIFVLPSKRITGGQQSHPTTCQQHSPAHTQSACMCCFIHAMSPQQFTT